MIVRLEAFSNTLRRKQLYSSQSCPVPIALFPAAGATTIWPASDSQHVCCSKSLAEDTAGCRIGCKCWLRGTILPLRSGRARDMLVSSTLIKTACLPTGTLLRSHETHCKNFTTLGSQNGNLWEDGFSSFPYLRSH